jgi:hypothetical protein
VKTFEEAMAKFRDCDDVDRDPYAAIIIEAKESKTTAELLEWCVFDAVQNGDPQSALVLAFCTGLMVGIEMEKP